MVTRTAGRTDVQFFVERSFAAEWNLRHALSSAESRRARSARELNRLATRVDPRENLLDHSPATTGARSRRNVMASKKKPLPRSLKLKSLAGGAPMCGNPLRFTMQLQQQTQWCWAAVSVSINLFYHPASGQTQCA